LLEHESFIVIPVPHRRKRYRLRPRSPLASLPPTSVPGVSILRPLKGLDTNLYENLESTFIQEYPNFEIFLSVADEHDQALTVVKDLISKYPDVKATVIIGTTPGTVFRRQSRATSHRIS
jgi:ceramide glucosyltransferase